MLRLSLVVIRSCDLDLSERFYSVLGCDFEKHSHGNGPEHLACELGDVVFEIYPQSTDGQSTIDTRIGFTVSNADQIVEQLISMGGSLIQAPKDSPWGRRAVVKDLDGHKVEIVSAN